MHVRRASHGRRFDGRAKRRVGIQSQQPRGAGGPLLAQVAAQVPHQCSGLVPLTSLHSCGLNTVFGRPRWTLLELCSRGLLQVLGHPNSPSHQLLRPEATRDTQHAGASFPPRFVGLAGGARSRLDVCGSGTTLADRLRPYKQSRQTNGSTAECLSLSKP